MNSSLYPVKEWKKNDDSWLRFRASIRSQGPAAQPRVHPGGDPLVAVLSHSFWMRSFGGDPEILSKTVRINGEPAEVVGVTAAGFKGLSIGGFFPQTDITLPLSSQPRLAGWRRPCERSCTASTQTFQCRSFGPRAVSWRNPARRKGIAAGCPPGAEDRMIGGNTDAPLGNYFSDVAVTQRESVIRPAGATGYQ